MNSLPFKKCFIFSLFVPNLVFTDLGQAKLTETPNPPITTTHTPVSPISSGSGQPTEKQSPIGNTVLQRNWISTATMPLPLRPIPSAPSMVNLPNGNLIVVGTSEISNTGILPQINLVGIDANNQLLPNEQIQTNAITSVLKPNTSTQATGLVQQSQGKFWVSGVTQEGNQTHGILVGFEPNGKLQAFGVNKKGLVSIALGDLQTQPQKVALQKGKYLIVAGFKMDAISQTPSNRINHKNAIFLQRYTLEGKLDETFGHLGTVLLPHPAESVQVVGLVVTAVGEIALATQSASFGFGGTTEAAIWAFDELGRPKMNLGTNGKLVFEDKTKRILNVVMLPDGIHFTVLGTKTNVGTNEENSVAFLEKRSLLDQTFTEAFVGSLKAEKPEPNKIPVNRVWNAMDFTSNGMIWLVVGEKWFQTSPEPLASALVRKYEMKEKKIEGTELLFHWPYPFVLIDIKILSSGQVALLGKAGTSSSVPGELKDKTLFFRANFP